MVTAYEVKQEIRALIGDDDHTNETYTDQKLDVFLRYALRRLANRVALTTTLTNGEFDVAPSTGAADLIVLQAACVIVTRELREESISKGASFKIDIHTMDTSPGLNGLKESVSGPHGICEMLEASIDDYIRNNPGLTIASPTSEHASNIWAGTSKLYDDVTFDGQSSGRVWKHGIGGRRSRRHTDHDRFLFDNL
jgi:hypothetical protein